MKCLGGWLLVLVLLSGLVEAACSSFTGTLLRSAVVAPTGRRRRESRDGSLDFDASGSLPKVEEAYRDLNDYASPVCAIRYVEIEVLGANDTSIERPGILLAFGSVKNSFNSGSRENSSVKLPQEYVGLRNHVSLSPGTAVRATEGRGGSASRTSSSSQQSILITGDIGDTRAATRMAMQISLNHTFDYDCAASGKYLAESLGDLVQQATMGPDNPLKAHVLIASTTPEHVISLHSVDAAGNVAEVMAGVAGRGMTKSMALLEEQYKPSISLAEAKELASRLINISATSLEEDVEGQKENQKEDEEESTYDVEFVIM